MEQLTQTEIDTAKAKSKTYVRSDRVVQSTKARAADAVKRATQPNIMPPQGGSDDDFSINSNRINSPGTQLVGVRIVWQDETETLLERDTILENYDPGSDSDWSISATISGLTATKAVTYDATSDFYDDVGSLQTVARIPIIRSGELITKYGFYREGIRCKDGDAVVEFYKV